MSIEETVLKNRSYRRYDESVPVQKEELLSLIDLARQTPSTGNIQPLVYAVSYTKETNDKIFPHTYWARMLKDYKGPENGERPTAYIIICTDNSITKDVEKYGTDAGISAQTMLLAATEKGLGGIMIKSFDKEDVKKILSLPDNYQPYMVVALGKPTEKIVLEEVGKDGKTSYYRDENQVHHVPKRRLSDIVFVCDK